MVLDSTSKIFPDSASQKQNFSESGIRIPLALHGADLITLVFVLYIKFWQKIGFFQTLLVGLYCHQKPEFQFELTTSNHFNSQRDKINPLKEYKFSSTLLTLCFVHLIFPKVSCPGV